MKHLPSNIRYWKNKVDKLDIDKSVAVPVDLSERSYVVKNDEVRKDVYNAKIENIEDKIPHITNLVTNPTLNATINEIKNEIPGISNLLLLKTKYLTLVI